MATSNNWQQLQILFHKAISLEGEERTAYLERECLKDEALRKEVESLLEASEEREDFLAQPALSLGVRVLASEESDSLIGLMIGSFKILSVLGRGGMGNVYLAEDTQLGRKVALKFLYGELAGDPWAKRQFTKEAQAAAMLDHPNICTVYGFEEKDGHSFIVMQYIEGERLDHLIEEEKPELENTLFLALQIAGALLEAHAHGIIHRDIKSSNIIVAANGQPKVLDFGLAKIVQQQQGELSAETLSKNSSQLGFIPGTIAYMSPEQLRGERLDYQTDIFSFGVVLYEMLSGKNPFARDSKAETISAILTEEPQTLRNGSPIITPELERVIQKCLHKEKRERYQSVSDLYADLEALQKSVITDRPMLSLISVRSTAAAVLLLLLITVATFIYSHLTRPHSIAILPIANETGDMNLDYLSDGVTESIIDKLSGLSKLRVKAFNTIIGYKGQKINPVEIGRKLDVDAVVIGTLTGTKDSPVVQVVMIDTSDGAQLWSNEYRVSNGVSPSLNDVAQQVVSILELWPRKDENKIATARSPKNTAQDEYMLGRYYWRLRDKENNNKAIEHFEAAIRLDPLYARAYAGLAESYTLLNTVHYGTMETKEAMSKAEWAAREALNLDPTLAEAHTSLGDINLRRYWNWQEAEKEFKRAIEIDPNYAPAHYSYSKVLVITGRFREAIAESDLANILDPFSPITTLNHCRVFYYTRDYNSASTCFKKLVGEQPDYRNAQYVQGLVYLRTGMYDEATQIFTKLYAEDKASAGAALGYAYGITGRKEEALKVISEMEALKSDQSYISPQEFAIIYTGLGDNENALVWLRKAADEKFAPLAYIGVDPLFDPLRSDPRFIDLLKSLNLPLRPAT